MSNSLQEHNHDRGPSTAPVQPRPKRWHHALLAQTRAELRMTLRNPEQLLVSVFIPLGILVFFSTVPVFETETRHAIDSVAPSVLALAVMSSALVSLGIGTGFERYYGVLKRLGTTPLGRPRWILAKLLTVVAIEFLQWLLIIPAALALGWNPAWGWGTAILAALLATLAFGGIGLLLAGTLPGMLNLAVCNALYLVLMLIGGVIIRLSVMPAPLATFARVLPTAPLTEIMQGAFRPADISLTSWLVLGTWALLAPVAAAVTFRWE